MFITVLTEEATNANYTVFTLESTKFTYPNNVLLVLSWRTGANREDCVFYCCSKPCLSTITFAQLGM
jgi:hypothetical protein